MKYLYVLIVFLICCCTISNNSSENVFLELNVTSIDTTFFKNYSLIKATNNQLEDIYMFAINDKPSGESQRIELNKSYLFELKKYSYDNKLTIIRRLNTPHIVYIVDENNSVIWSSDSLEQTKISENVKIYYALNVKNLFITE